MMLGVEQDALNPGHIIERLAALQSSFALCLVQQTGSMYFYVLYVAVCHHHVSKWSDKLNMLA